MDLHQSQMRGINLTLKLFIQLETFMVLRIFSSVTEKKRGLMMGILFGFFFKEVEE